MGYIYRGATRPAFIKYSTRRCDRLIGVALNKAFKCIANVVSDMEDQIQVTFSQEDIDQARRDGYVVKKNIGFYMDDHGRRQISRNVDAECWFYPSTLYIEGVAYWETVLEDQAVVATYERPSLREWVESEREHYQQEREEADWTHYEEWLDGILFMLNCIDGWAERVCPECDADIPYRLDDDVDGCHKCQDSKPFEMRKQ